MNISLKLKRGQLDALIGLLQEVTQRRPETVQEKCVYYLYASGLKKLLKKQLDKADDLSAKPFKITLRYEEAFSVYMRLDYIDASHPIYDVYAANVMRTVKNNLYRQLQ